MVYCVSPKILRPLLYSHPKYSFPWTCLNQVVGDPSFQPDYEILKEKETICAEILRVMEIFLALYNTMVWRPAI